MQVEKAPARPAPAFGRADGYAPRVCTISRPASRFSILIDTMRSREAIESVGRKHIFASSQNLPERDFKSRVLLLAAVERLCCHCSPRRTTCATERSGRARWSNCASDEWDIIQGRPISRTALRYWNSQTDQKGAAASSATRHCSQSRCRG